MALQGVELMANHVQKKVETAEEIENAAAWVAGMLKRALPSGAAVITLSRPGKSRDQEAKYHAMISDIQRQCFRGYSLDGVKAVLVNQFALEMDQAGEPLANPGEKVWDWKSQEPVYVRPSTKKFRKAEASQFIEFLHSVGAEYDVQWSDASLAAYDEIIRAQNG
jgi:hypothetical protein